MCTSWIGMESEENLKKSFIRTLCGVDTVEIRYTTNM